MFKAMIGVCICMGILFAVDDNLQQLTHAEKMKHFAKDFDPKKVDVSMTQRYYRYFEFHQIEQEGIYTLKRADALTKLSKLHLDTKEKAKYKALLTENIAFFKPISSVSLVSSKSCKYDLVYLGAEETNKGLLVVEKRLVKGKLKSYSIYLKDRVIEKFACGDDNTQGYLDHINEIVSDSLSMKMVERPKTKEVKNIAELELFYDAINDVNDERKSLYVVVKNMEAVSIQKGKHVVIPLGSRVLFEKRHGKNEVFFYMNNVAYRAILNLWKASTQKKLKE